MEDRAVCECLVDDLNTCFAGVYDGHEGSRVSQLLADEFHMSLKTRLATAVGWLNVDEVQLKVEASLASLNEDFLVLAEEENWTDGSTAVFALVWEGSLLIGNVGNSRAVLCKQAKSCENLSQKPSGGNPESLVLLETEDHTPDRPDERKRIIQSGNSVEDVRGILRLNGELELSRALGDFPYLDRGLIATPEFYHRNLTAQDGFLILASDGVFEKMTSEALCQLAEDTRLSCKVWKPTPFADPPIALAGEVASQSEQQSNSEMSRGIRRESSGKVESTPELKGCIDCGDAQPPNVKETSFSETEVPLEKLVAEKIMEEAYNRVSMDNIAVVALNLASHKDGPTWRSQTKMIPGTIRSWSADDMYLRSPDREYEYRLLDKVAVLPGSTSDHWHVHWDSSTPPRPHKHADTSSGIVLRKESWEQAVLTKLPLSQIQSADAAVQLAECVAPPFEAQNELADSGTCQAQCSDRYAALGLVRALGSLPLVVSGSGDNEEKENPSIKSEQAFQQYTHYKLQGKFAAGSFGEVWRAAPMDLNGSALNPTDGVLYIMKRLMMEKGERVVLSGLRELYFGELFQRRVAEAELKEGYKPEGYDHLVRFVESFEIQPGPELWLVFRDEGKSLHSMMYNEVSSQKRSSFSGPCIVKPSEWWRKMRENEGGEAVFKSILHQLLLAVEFLHRENVTHRDIKPENILLRGAATFEQELQLPEVRLIDFGSAVDNYTCHNMYGKAGPSEDEETQEYAPPEARFARQEYHKLDSSSLQAFDMWSIGVVWLEYILGTPHVFRLPERARALLIHRLNLSTLLDAEQEQAFLLRAMMEFCIYPPPQGSPSCTMSERQGMNGVQGGSVLNLEAHEDEAFYPTNGQGTEKEEDLSMGLPKTHNEAPTASVVSWSCSEEALTELIKSRDPTGRGLPGKNALRLLRSLLAWDSESRITAREALSALYFKE